MTLYKECAICSGWVLSYWYSVDSDNVKVIEVSVIATRSSAVL